MGVRSKGYRHPVGLRTLFGGRLLVEPPSSFVTHLSNQEWTNVSLPRSSSKGRPPRRLDPFTTVLKETDDTEVRRKVFLLFSCFATS